jgi:hypothetical protein
MSVKDLEKISENFSEVFNNELFLLKKYVASELDGRRHEARILPATACSTGLALCELSKKPDYFYSEIVMLSRSYIEKIVNYCYVQVCNDEEYEKFLYHPYYRLYHNSNKEKFDSKGTIKLKYSNHDDLKSNPKIAKALDLFSEEKSNLNWSDLNIDKKIDVLSKVTDIDTRFFLINTHTIYSDASEALHGSLFGCALSTNAFRLDDIDPKVTNLKSLCLIFALLSSVTHELLKQNYNEKDLLLASKENQEKDVSLMKEMLEA